MEFEFSLSLSHPKPILLLFNVTLPATLIGKMYECPSTTQVMDRNRIPWTQVRLLDGWVVHSSLDPFVYTENAKNTLIQIPVEEKAETGVVTVHMHTHTLH